MRLSITVVVVVIVVVVGIRIYAIVAIVSWRGVIYERRLIEEKLCVCICVLPLLMYQ